MGEPGRRARPPVAAAGAPLSGFRHFSPRTEEAYVGWVVRFVRVYDLTPPQALAAFAFLYREILRTPLAGLGQIPQIKGPQRLPVVLTPAEAQRLLGQLRERMWLIGMLLYGGGLRLRRSEPGGLPGPQRSGGGLGRHR